MTAVIREDADWGGQVFVAPTQLILFGLLGTPIWIAGLVRLLRSPHLRTYRAFGIAYLVVLVLVIVTGGRNYYVAGAYPVLIAAGSVAAVGWSKRRIIHYTAIALAALMTVAMALPVFPIGVLADTPQPSMNYAAAETVGWPEVTAAVATVYNGLPDKSHAVILASNYGEAGAIAHYGLS